MSKQTRGHTEVEIQTENLTARFYFNEAFISLQSRTSTDQDRFTNHQEINFEKKSGVLCCVLLWFVGELSWHTGLSYPRSCCRGCTASERSSEPPPGHTRTQQPGTDCWSLWRQK